MLDEHVQQWSAIQAIRAAGLNHEEILIAYLDVTDDVEEVEAEGYLSGLIMLPVAQRDALAQVINEMLDSVGSLVDGAHYSDHDAAVAAGYDEYLRAMTLSPDGYDFAAPPAGDHTTSNSAGNSPSDLDSNLVTEGSEEGWVDESADGGTGGVGAGREMVVGDPAEAEVLRCLALYESGLLDRGAEERFDRITRRVRDYFGVSSASIALITGDAQVIKSVTGPIGQDLPRNLALCARTIEADRTLVIADAGVDPAWKDHPLVTGGPNIRFYAGHPVSSVNGWRIGTLCLIDDRPRIFTEDDERALRGFAAQVQIEIWV